MALPPLATLLSVLLVGPTLPFLGELVALAGISVGIAYLCFRMRLVPIAGFLLTGVVVGPFALGFVQDLELVNQMAEVGVILLLFTIGLEFSFEEMGRLGRQIFVGGGLQVLITLGIVTGVLVAAGLEVRVSLFTGSLVALSSTAIVLGLLQERAESDTPPGRLSLAILIFQDLAIIAMVLIVPLLAGVGESAGGMLWSLAKALLLIGVVMLLARRVVPWILMHIAGTRRQELFLLAVVAICFGTAYLTSLAGVSLALGAFLAGLVVSETHYSEQAMSEVLPLRTLFNAVFFISVGMLLDLRFVLSAPLLILAVAIGVLLVKVVATSLSVVALGFPLRVASATALALAQIGEFSFVLERTGRDVGLTPAGLGESGAQAFIAVTVLLMLATPALVAVAPRMSEWFSGLFVGTGEGVAEESGETAGFEDHVVVAGYGPAGRRLVAVLRETGIPFVVVDLNPENIRDAQAADMPVLFGDASRLPILEQAGIREAKVFVVVINDRRAVERMVRVAHFANPTLQIFARTRFLHEVEPLQRAGADIVVPEELETTVRLFTHVLGAYMIPPDEVNRQVNVLRASDYGVLRGSIQEAHMMVLQGLDEEGLHTRAVAVRPGAPAAGRTLAELGLRQQFGLTVLAIRRGRRTIGGPSGEFRIEPGDRLVLIGEAVQFAACAGLFRAERVPPDGESLP